MRGPRRKKRLLPSGMLLALLLGTVLVPSLLTLSVGIVSVALWGDESQGLVIGVLTLTFAASALAGGVTAIMFVRRSARLAEMQADFVANASHQLRTPLAGLRLVADTLAAGRGDDPGRLAELVEMLSDEVARLDSLVARVLTWRRLDEGVALHHEAVDLGEVVRTAVGTIGRLPEGRDATIVTRIAPDLPAVLGDRHVLVEAVTNLVHNGVKFAGDRGPIEVEAGPADGGAVVVVRDHGLGLGADAMGHVFERFYQAPEHRTNRAGTGLGLAIVKSAAEAHGGRAEVASTPGEGTRFSLWLPCARAGRAERHV